MRIGLVLAAVALIGAAPPHKAVPLHSPAPKPLLLPVFEFRGIRAGEPASQETLAKCGSGEKIECVETGVTIADAYVIGLNTTYYQSKLSELQIFAKTVFFARLTDAFTAKYGKPCKQEVVKIHNRMGAAFDNLVSTWCFASGNLKAELYGVDLDTSLITYEDQNQPPKVKPKVDF